MSLLKFEDVVCNDPEVLAAIFWNVESDPSEYKKLYIMKDCLEIGRVYGLIIYFR